MSILPGTFWLVGCGNMGQAMLDGWIAAGQDPTSFLVIRPSGKPVGHGVRVVTDYPQGKPPAIVLLGMKPYQVDAVAADLAPRLGPDTILISMLAGIEQASLRARFPAPRTVVKSMPGLPVRLNKGVVDLYSDTDDLAAKAQVTDLMSALGHAEWFDDEALFQVAGMLTGAGPAFLFRFIDAMAAAGTSLGIPPEQAARLSKAMVEGAAAMAAASPESPETLARRVASPKGTTEAGLAVLDAENSLRNLMTRTLDASRRRALELAAESRR